MYKLRHKYLTRVRTVGTSSSTVVGYLLYLIHDVCRVITLLEHGVTEERVCIEEKLQSKAQKVILVHTAYIRQII